MDTNSTPKSAFKSPFFWVITLLPIVIAAILAVVISYSHYGDLVDNTCFDEWTCWGLFLERYMVVVYLLISSLFLAFTGFAAFNIQSTHDKLKVIWSASEELARKTGERFLWIAGGIIFGCWITLTNTAKDSTDFWAAFGAMIAGVGTIGILLFGWIKTKEWVDEALFKKLIDIVVEEVRQLLENSARLSIIYHQEFNDEKVEVIMRNKDLDVAIRELKGITPKTIDYISKVLSNLDMLISCYKNLSGDDSESILRELEQLRADLGKVNKDYYLGELEDQKTTDLEGLKDHTDEVKDKARDFTKRSREISDSVISNISNYN